ncbi:MAG TPA: hypothetical protein VEC19_12160 [Usitatibacter sp.]|nr:hypothetical protein [Usitatibacter sp.]
MNRRIRDIALLALAFAALAASAQGMQAHILMVDSEAQVKRWLAAPADQRASDQFRQRNVPIGKKVMMPVVVTGVQPKNAELRITADFELVAPDGKVVASAKACCRGVAQAGMSPGPIVLQPMIDVTADPGDLPGEYSVRYTVTDGVSTTTAAEKFYLAAAPGRGDRARVPDARRELGAAKGDSKAADGVPALRSRGSAPGDRDMRHCLGLATQAEILKCAEMKK